MVMSIGSLVFLQDDVSDFYKIASCSLQRVVNEITDLKDEKDIRERFCYSSAHRC